MKAQKLKLLYNSLFFSSNIKFDYPCGVSLKWNIC